MNKSKQKPTNKEIKKGAVPESVIVATIDNPPEFIQASRYALSEWKRLKPVLEQFNLIKAQDLNTFSLMCFNYGIWRENMEFLSLNGQTYTTPSGQIKPRPEIDIAKNAQKVYLDLSREYGLTPLARERIKNYKAGKENKKGLEGIPTNWIY